MEERKETVDVDLTDVSSKKAGHVSTRSLAVKHSSSQRRLKKSLG